MDKRFFLTSFRQFSSPSKLLEYLVRFNVVHNDEVVNDDHDWLIDWVSHWRIDLSIPNWEFTQTKWERFGVYTVARAVSYPGTSYSSGYCAIFWHVTGPHSDSRASNRNCPALDNRPLVWLWTPWTVFLFGWVHWKFDCSLFVDHRRAVEIDYRPLKIRNPRSGRTYYLRKLRNFKESPKFTLQSGRHCSSDLSFWSFPLCKGSVDSIKSVSSPSSSDKHTFYWSVSNRFRLRLRSY